MLDEALGDFEEAFFAAGDALAQQRPTRLTPEELMFFGGEVPARPRFIDRVTSSIPSTNPAANPSTYALWAAVAGWMRWQARLLQFRLAVAVSTQAEHVLRFASGRALRPLVVTRHPWLVRGSVVLLTSSLANYSAAAVLAATGAF